MALLRGVNLGPSRRVSMAELRAELGRRGATGVRTYVQSGNVLLSCAGEPGALVREAVLAQGVDSAVVVRTAEELTDVVARNPWPERVDEPTRIAVGFLSAPGEGTVRRVAEDEQARFDGAEVWLWYGQGQGRSRLTLGVGDRVVTVRNWRTVTTLAAMAAQG